MSSDLVKCTGRYVPSKSIGVYIEFRNMTLPTKEYNKRNENGRVSKTPELDRKQLAKHFSASYKRS